ncbi:MAG: hypothetical protein ABI882_07560 [Acidobacteriota bacterium]
MAKKKVGSGKKGTQTVPDKGRRQLLYLGLGAVAATGATAAAYKAGWFSSAPEGGGPATPGLTILRKANYDESPENAIRACDEMITHYARGLDNPSALIHAVRAEGRDFRRADGSRAVDFLCSKFAADKEVNGKRYVYFLRDAEVHDNSFLKTFLEANVSLDQPVIVGATRYTLRDVANSAKSLFRADPENLDPLLVHDHLPWTLIAFSILMPPSEPEWTNAYDERINMVPLIDRSLAEFEKTCSLTEEALERGQPEPVQFRETIKKYSCFGLHSVYAFLSCLKHGYRGNDLPARLTRMLDIVSYRLKGDATALDREYAEEGKGAPPIVVQALYLRAIIKLYGHALESINYVKLHKLIPITPGEDRRFQEGLDDLNKSIFTLRLLDWDALRRNVNQMLGPGRGDVFISDIIIALGHAARGLKLLTSQNPDTAA